MGFSVGRDDPQGHIAKWKQPQVTTPCLSRVSQSLLGLSCAVIRNIDQSHIPGGLTVTPADIAHSVVAGKEPPQAWRTEPQCAFPGVWRGAIARQTAACPTDHPSGHRVPGEFAEATPISVLSKRTLS
jgi:hypothetical protein